MLALLSAIHSDEMLRHAGLVEGIRPGSISGKSHLTERWMPASTMQMAVICDLLRAPHLSPKYRGVLAVVLANQEEIDSFQHPGIYHVHV